MYLSPESAMKELFYLIFVGFLTKATLCLDYITEKPDYLSPCSIKASNFVECSTRTMQQLFDQLREGIPGLKTLQRSDPYHIHKVKLLQNNDAASLAVELTSIAVKGLGNVVIKENMVDERDYSFSTKFFIPKLRIDGDYKMNGRLLLLTLKGQGKLFIELEKADVNMLSKLKLYEKGGFTFGNVTDVKLDFKIRGLKVKLDNLFNGATELEDSINTLINENWMDFLEALRPTLTQTVENIMLDNLRTVFHFIPAVFFISDIPTSEQLYG